MIRKVLSVIAISLLFCIACPIVLAQNAGAPGSTLYGYVTGVDNRTVANATVSLYPEGASPMEPAKIASTDAAGYYAFHDLPPGNYSVDASKDYYIYTATTRLSGDDESVNLTLPMQYAGRAD